jgi:hypothetical protein
LSLILEANPELVACGADVRQNISRNYQAIVAALPGVDIAALLHSQPRLLFVDVAHGLQELRELWDVEDDVFQDSDSDKLALAILSLSVCNPRK